MSKLPTGLVTLNNNLLSVVDLETTGLIAGYHEIVQICVLPLNADLDPLEDVSPFYMKVKPMHEERIEPKAMQINGLKLDELRNCPTPEQVAETFYDWFDELNLPQGKRLAYLTQNAPFDIAFLKLWLGHTGFDRIFMRRGRDTMFAAQMLNDRAAYQAKPVPFPGVGLKDLTSKLGIQFDDHHDALADCIATAKVYKELLRMSD